MSKVVHLSDVAHQLAKAHCRDRGLRMSDWVAELIALATDRPHEHAADHGHQGRVEERAHLPLSRHSRPHGLKEVERSRQRRGDGDRTLDDAAAAAYAAPPFWAQS